MWQFITIFLLSCCVATAEYSPVSSKQEQFPENKSLQLGRDGCETKDSNDVSQSAGLPEYEKKVDNGVSVGESKQEIGAGNRAYESGNIWDKIGRP
jgi:hypothetical protein